MLATLHRLLRTPALWVALATAYLAIHAAGWLPAHPPLRGDAHSHAAVVATLAERIASGEGWWCDLYNLGFPMALYYQPLPHVISALVTLVVGGPHAATGVIKALGALAIVGLPVSTWIGLRTAGVRSERAAIAGVLMALISPSLPLGLSPATTLAFGLYTQAWANLLLPLTLGHLVATLQGRGRLIPTTLLCAALAGSHVFYGIALVPIVALTLATEPRARWRPGLRQLSLTGAGAALLLLPWWLPMLATRAFMGGWPPPRPDIVHGIGWSGQFGLSSLGWEILDGDTLPILGVLALAGALWAWRRRDPLDRLALVAVAWSLPLLIGRPLVGGLVDWIPLHSELPLFRYAAPRAPWPKP